MGTIPLSCIGLVSLLVARRVLARTADMIVIIIVVKVVNDETAAVELIHVHKFTQIVTLVGDSVHNNAVGPLVICDTALALYEYRITN
jgi:hypothetical protein